MAEEQQPKPQYQKPQVKLDTDKDNPNFKYIVRIANTDLDGKKKVFLGLQKIKGISFMLANAFCSISKVDQNKRVGDLSDADIEKLDVTIRNKKPDIPGWLLNRRNDIETGETMHIVGADLTFQNESDIRLLKKMKCYRGVRHMLGQPVRGQRTKANFRKNKGKVTSIKRSVVAKASAAASKSAGAAAKSAGKK